MGWDGKWIKHTPLYNISQKLPTRSVPNPPIVANRCLAKVGVGFMSTASMLVPSVSTIWSVVTLYRFVKELSGKQTSSPSSLITLHMDTFCAWILAYAIK